MRDEGRGTRNEGGGQRQESGSMNETTETARRFEIVRGADPRAHSAVLMEGLVAINEEAPTGSTARELYDRIVETCNRPDAPGCVLLLAVDHEPPTKDVGACAAPRVAAWVTLWLCADWMGTPLVCVVHLWCRPGYRRQEPVRALVGAVDFWTKSLEDIIHRPVRRQTTLTGRYDKQDKTRGTVTAYSRWIQKLGFKQAETMFVREIQ
jgi:hypothetical protein